MSICNVLQQIKEQLNAESVTVKDAYGDGRHVRWAYFLTIEVKLTSRLSMYVCMYMCVCDIYIVGNDL